MDSLPPEKKKKVVASEYVKIIIMYGSYYPFKVALKCVGVRWGI